MSKNGLNTQNANLRILILKTTPFNASKQSPKYTTYHLYSPRHLFQLKCIYFPQGYTMPVIPKKAGGRSSVSSCFEMETSSDLFNDEGAATSIIC